MGKRNYPAAFCSGLLDDLSLADSPIFMAGPHVITMGFFPSESHRPETVAFRQH
jgi:hypothetical protein